jgi:hypothetical protein
MDKLLCIQNGEKVNRADIPHLSFAAFREELLSFTEAGGQVVQFFTYEDKDADRLKMLAVLRNDKLFVTGCDAPDNFDSLTAETEKFHMFEREIGEQYGLKPEGPSLAEDGALSLEHHRQGRCVR